MTYEKKHFDFWKYGAFFAFWKEQFNHWMDKNLTVKDYIALPSWLIAKKINYKEMRVAFLKHEEDEKNRRCPRDSKRILNR